MNNDEKYFPGPDGLIDGDRVDDLVEFDLTHMSLSEIAQWAREGLVGHYTDMDTDQLRKTHTQLIGGSGQ